MARSGRSATAVDTPLKIILMKLPESGARRMRGDNVELLPTNAAHAAIVVGLDLKSGGGERKLWELRDRPRRQQGDRDPLGSYVEAGDASAYRCWIEDR